MQLEGLLPPILLTLSLAGVTMLVLIVIGVPIAWGLARWRWAGWEAVAAVIALPLVLPPTVLGFYLDAVHALGAELSISTQHVPVDAAVEALAAASGDTA